MKSQGFTLFELMICTAVLAITLGLAIPSLFEQIKTIRTKVATHELLRAIESARTLAVTSNKRSVLLANQNDWEQGWALFIDYNNDGVLNGEETLKQQRKALKDIKIHANSHVEEYISFIGTGEGRKIGIENGGAFQVGTIKICPETSGKGYALILSRGGRTRIQNLTLAECAEVI
ncbi:GspH/FimT family pseudopilin [Cellvibrio sp. NN19]|uniref:GspH/FimT family pseudopilin n=1 Tax=Cellvibrio chitinivorans TaxID=3102792 RepID=UPI002B417424|nr:GspH/FimT family pseudopilin [Cellvibrio sp. NN19]